MLERYRNILLNATYKKPTEPRFPETHTEPNDDSREYIRELAELGRDMYQELYDPDNDERLAVFRKMLASNNQVVSIIRHDFEFAWPWAIMYDFPLPRNLLGRTPRVCFGFDNGQECGHRGQEAVCCVRGFWGYRHQIEELYGGRMKRARINSVKIAPGPAIGYIGSTGTSYEEKMKTDLKALGSATAIQPDKFLDTLWDQSQRPAVVVVLGHMETRDLTNEPTGPRIVLGSSGGDAPAMCWLRSTEVMDYVQRNPWPRPESIVILLSCGSGGITPATLSNLVLSFLKANASAVVGTECDVWTQLLARWGTELAQGMIRDHQSLGETVTAGRRRLLQQGIPLAFVFNSVGVADLRLEP